MTDGRGVDRSVECTSTFECVHDVYFLLQLSGAIKNGGVLVINSKLKKPKVTVVEAATMVDNSDLDIFLVDISVSCEYEKSDLLSHRRILCWILNVYCGILL